jgi:hypothetical protein
MSAARDISLVFSVDVEEEGLFSGRYNATANSVSNVASLSRLEFLSRDFGLPLTLLCTWPVLNDPGCVRLLRRWQEELGVEIGCHLHPWNTPPLDVASTSWTPSEAMPRELLNAKLETLVHACTEVSGQAPTSFRMGRFDFGPAVRALLPSHGLRVDSSMVPLRFAAGLPEHFRIPADPFSLNGDGAVKLLEAPLTVVPLLRGLDRAAYAVADLLPRPLKGGLLSGFRKIAAVGVQPVWYPLPSMKLGARLHLSRGGRMLHLFLHSSELMPGACPHLPDEAAVERVVARLRSFVLWLRARATVRGMTLAGLARESGLASGPEARP